MWADSGSALHHDCVLYKNGAKIKIEKKEKRFPVPDIVPYTGDFIWYVWTAGECHQYVVHYF